MQHRSWIFLSIFLCFSTVVAGQTSSCPTNFGFEDGSFNGWKCFGGQIAPSGSIAVSATGPLDNRHTILQNTNPQQKDPYGNFPVNCPNGSGYSVKLGNTLSGGQADRISYTFTVPINKNEYSFIYNYAIVFQNPPHAEYEQPKFSSRVFDETAGEYLGCGAFEFIASSGLPGFQQASSDVSVWYKPWSPVTVKLNNCAGKTITIEFTVNDCSRGGHFGYAYLDVNENCTSPISGNVYCNGAKSMTLSAPFGFREYEWYNSDFSTVIGNTNTLHFDPVPPIGTRYALVLHPYPGLGCLDTLYTTIEHSPEAFNFSLKDTITACENNFANLTDPFVTQGSSPGLSFSYFLDSNQLEYLATPTQVTTANKYYIKAENAAGCSEVRPVVLRFQDLRLLVTNPTDECFPNTIDITDPAITAGSENGLLYTYWKNNEATIPLAAPHSISETGVYYIRAQSENCVAVAGVSVRIWTPDDFKITDVSQCAYADLTDASITAGSAPVFTHTYWQDVNATASLSNPENITTSSTYYIKASTSLGCSFIKPVNVTVKPAPEFSVVPPSAVTAPETNSIINSASASNIYTYTYWLNAQATNALSTPGKIEKSGTYYIRATDSEGCSTVKPVAVTVIVPYHPDIRFPNAFSPNGDGLNDGFRIDIAGDFTYKAFKIYNRWGQVVFETKDPLQYWYGTQNGKPLPAGTYYWIMELVNNNNQDFYRKTGSITLLR